METKEKSLVLPPLEKLALASSETEDGAAPGRTLDLEGKEQKMRKVPEVSGTDEGKDQAAESSEDKPGPSESNRSPQKTEPVSPQEVDQNWYGPMNAAIMRELFPLRRGSVQQPPVSRSQTPTPYAVRSQSYGFRSYSYGRNGPGRRNHYDHDDSYYDDLNLSVHDIHDFDDDTDTVCD